MEVDILREFPKRINIGMKLKTNVVAKKWITIKTSIFLNTIKLG